MKIAPTYRDGRAVSLSREDLTKRDPLTARHLSYLPYPSHSQLIIQNARKLVQPNIVKYSHFAPPGGPGTSRFNALADSNQNPIISNQKIASLVLGHSLVLLPSVVLLRRMGGCWCLDVAFIYGLQTTDSGLWTLDCKLPPQRYQELPSATKQNQGEQITTQRAKNPQFIDQITKNKPESTLKNMQLLCKIRPTLNVA